MNIRTAHARDITCATSISSNPQDSWFADDAPPRAGDTKLVSAALRAMRFTLAALLLVGALVGASSARADSSPCVSTVAQLVAAIGTFDTQNDDDVLTIRLQQGTYELGALPNWLHQSLAQNLTFKMLGGYTSGCNSRVIDPANTVISGNSQSMSGIEFDLRGNSTAFVEGITFTDMHGDANGDFAALRFSLLYPGQDSVFQVRYCNFIHNVGYAALSLEGTELLVDSSLIADNTLLGQTPVGALSVEPDNFNAYVIVMNNTIANNIGGAGVLWNGYFTQNSSRLSDITDNILWGNSLDFAFINFVDSMPLSHEFNIIGSWGSGFTPSPSDLDVDPRFDTGAGTYALMSNSPAINKGNPFQAYGFPALDAAGNPRIVGSRVDIGGYESSFDDNTEVLVTTTADNGSNSSPTAGSLRAAIKAANAASGPFAVKFQIPGGCSQSMELAAALPDITGDVSIDGTTQPGWTANDSTTGFDANLCIVLNGNRSNGQWPWALHVPGGTPGAHAKLTVSGLIFTSFGDAAIKLEGGADHRIVGNQFAPIFIEPANHQAIQIINGAGAARIGDSDPASRNLIGGASDAAIVLSNDVGGSIVENNLIGVQDNGGNFGNGGGVQIVESPNNQIRDNVIGWNASTGIEIAGPSATHNLLIQNRIGLSGTGGQAPNGSAGVRVEIGAKDNDIGAPLLAAYSGNLIAFNNGPGVWLTNTGGDGNTVLDNAFFGNTGLDIDLSDLGPTPNQTVDPTAVPNERQNYPVLDAAQASLATGNETVLGVLQGLPNESYRIDVYWATACGPSGRGTGELRLGSAKITAGTSGKYVFSFELLATNHPSVLGVVSATATDYGNAQASGKGDTSEIGNCVTETMDDTIFKDGFE